MKTDIHSEHLRVGDRQMIRPTVKKALRGKVPAEKLSVDGYIDEVERISREGTNTEEFRTVRVLAKDGDSAVTKSIWQRLERMRDRGVRVVAIFAKTKNKKLQTSAVEKYVEVFGEDAALKNIRVANLRKASKLQEQLQLGKSGVWTEGGEKIKADEGAVEVRKTKPTDPDLAASRVAFNMVWAVSEPLAKQNVLNSGKPRSKNRQ